MKAQGNVADFQEGETELEQKREKLQDETKTRVTAMTKIYKDMEKEQTDLIMKAEAKVEEQNQQKAQLNQDID